MSRQNLLCRDTNSCKMEELVKTKESIERRSSVATRKFMWRLVTLTCLTGLVVTKEPNVETYFRLRKSIYVGTRILMSQHKNKLNRKKRGRDRLLYVTTKVSTQCKEVM